MQLRASSILGDVSYRSKDRLTQLILFNNAGSTWRGGGLAKRAERPGLP